MPPWFTPRIRVSLAWLCVGVHALALGASALALAPGLPPVDVLARRAFVIAHPIAWGLGWATWMLAALTLLLFFIAWADTLPQRGWTLFALGLAVMGAVADWLSETTWIWLAPAWALRAGNDSFYANLYSIWERAYIVLSPGLANLLYTLGGLALNLIALRTRPFPKWLGGWGLIVWLLSLVLSGVAFMGYETWLTPTTAGVFALFLPWAALMGHGWLIRAHTFEHLGVSMQRD